MRSSLICIWIFICWHLSTYKYKRHSRAICQAGRGLCLKIELASPQYNFDSKYNHSLNMGYFCKDVYWNWWRTSSVTVALFVSRLCNWYWSATHPDQSLHTRCSDNTGSASPTLTKVWDRSISQFDQHTRQCNIVFVLEKTCVCVCVCLCVSLVVYNELREDVCVLLVL